MLAGRQLLRFVIWNNELRIYVGYMLGWSISFEHNFSLHFLFGLTIWTDFSYKFVWKLTTYFIDRMNNHKLMWRHMQHKPYPSKVEFYTDIPPNLFCLQAVFLYSIGQKCGRDQSCIPLRIHLPDNRPRWFCRCLRISRQFSLSSSFVWLWEFSELTRKAK